MNTSRFSSEEPSLVSCSKWVQLALRDERRFAEMRNGERKKPQKKKKK